MKRKFTGNLIFNFMITAALAAFFYGCKTAQSRETPKNQAIAQTSPAVTPISKQISPVEIKSDEVSVLALETVYKNYFEEGSKCRKTYNEYFGNEDGVGSSSSPCTINFSFEKEGGARKTVQIRRYDRAAKEFKTIEKSIWTARISGEQFDALAKIITENEAFKSWQDGMQINISNSKISATHPKGTRTVMSNVDEKTIQFLPMMDAFGRLDKEIKWEKAQ
ncbi:MAG TPA: hypothetical protein VGC76_13820 [Pyrinomonadaceae bacterium]|jgi:hypothetical protein